jgi:hypothetical protein
MERQQQLLVPPCLVVVVVLVVQMAVMVGLVLQEVGLVVYMEAVAVVVATEVLEALP